MGGAADKRAVRAVATVRDAVPGPEDASITASRTSSPSPASASASMMAHNFFDADARQSRYIQATQKSFQVLNSMRNSQYAVLQAGQTTVGALDVDDYAGRVLEGQKAARNMEKTKDVAVSETSEENLEDIRETIEENAEEAVSLKDENGSVGTEDAPSTPAEDLEQAQNADTPESADGQPPATDADTASTAAEDHAAQPAPVSGSRNTAAATPSTPNGDTASGIPHVTPSLNIMV